MYKSLTVHGFMKDDPTKELTWPWPLYLQHSSSSAQVSSEQVRLRSASCLQFVTYDARQVSVHLTSRQKQWLPQTVRLEQAARQVSKLCFAAVHRILFITWYTLFLFLLRQALAQVDNCWQPTKDRPASRALDLATVLHHEHNCIDAPQVHCRASGRVCCYHAPSPCCTRMPFLSTDLRG